MNKLIHEIVEVASVVASSISPGAGSGVRYRKFAAAAAAAALCFGLVSCGSDNGNPTPATPVTIQPLSNRADLISGGSALVEIKLPGGASAKQLKVDIDGTDVTSSFTTLANGRTLGVVKGLKNGTNNLNATSTDGSFNGARLVITNYPIGGPVLLSAQTTPWICATPAAVAASGNTPASNPSGLITTAVDAQCNIATEYNLFYRTNTPVTVTAGDGGCSFVLPDPSPKTTAATPANSCFQPYVTGTTLATAVASTTTTAGVTVPYIVRVERGTINRGIYDIAVLFDPTKPAWTPTTPQPQWNGKVVYSYGASTGQPRLQFRSEQNWADDMALSRGFMVVDNSVTDSLYNSNRVLVAETTMMMKEYIVENYGEITFTMANGCSGGSINQNTVASIYPGLLDGIQPSCDFSDSITTGMEVSDCVLLVNAYVNPSWTALMAGLTQAQIIAKKTAINGHLDQTACHGWTNLFGSNNKPGNYVPMGVVDNATGGIGPIGAAKNNCGLPAALVYDPLTNPTGTRCGDPDLAAAVWGTTAGIPAGSTRALTTNDNVGIQYGLKALLVGTIMPEEFVTLNEKIGGTDADSTLTAARSVADSDALGIAYKGGIVSSGANLGKLPIIDQRGYDEFSGNLALGQYGIHLTWRSFAERARLDADAGSHANQVMFRFGTGLTPLAASGIALLSFTTMDTWISSLVTSAPKAWLNAPRTQAQVVAAKPSTAFDFCYLSTDTTFSTKVTDQATCDADAKLVARSSPRQVAGGPLVENILKCQLKPLAFSDYTGITFTAAQQTRLQAVFSTGVCDWSKSGVGQQAPVSPQTYKAGPSGVPLPAAPQSNPI
jgi:hypothetical protein